jgi:hypothetical protein
MRGFARRIGAEHNNLQNYALTQNYHGVAPPCGSFEFLCSFCSLSSLIKTFHYVNNWCRGTRAGKRKGTISQESQSYSNVDKKVVMGLGFILTRNALCVVWIYTLFVQLKLFEKCQQLIVM